jgi:hypothetical protein
MALNRCSSTSRVDGSEAGCEDVDVSDVEVREVSKGDAVQSRWRQVLHPKLHTVPFSGRKAIAEAVAVACPSCPRALHAPCSSKIASGLLLCGEAFCDQDHDVDAPSRCRIIVTLAAVARYSGREGRTRYR